jgi:hypothetical protein
LTITEPIESMTGSGWERSEKTSPRPAGFGQKRAFPHISMKKTLN